MIPERKTSSTVSEGVRKNGAVTDPQDRKKKKNASRACGRADGSINRGGETALAPARRITRVPLYNIREEERKRKNPKIWVYNHRRRYIYRSNVISIKIDWEPFMKLYFAGPLFCNAEKEFNEKLTAKIEMLGIEVFLPQRDGIEKDKEPYNVMSKEDRRKAIFELDEQKIEESDIFLFVLDGRVPDEGACVELGIAHAHRKYKKGMKKILGLMTDIRTSYTGEKLSAMIIRPIDELYEDEEKLLQRMKEFAT